MSDSAVRAKTGKVWSEWIELLDRVKAHEWPHKEIALHLRKKHGVGDWWCQMVTVGYERAKGLRAKHQKADGFAASASKTIAAPVEALFDAWESAALRRRWLDEPGLAVRRATRAKSLRITWGDGSSVNVTFWSKGPQKSQVSIDHEKLASAADVARMKSRWRDALEKLKPILER
jgi:hypothetical protein